jgi:hypothetical protein
MPREAGSSDRSWKSVTEKRWRSLRPPRRDSRGGFLLRASDWPLRLNPGRERSPVSISPLKMVCHWLCQCCVQSAFAGNSALAEPVAHVVLVSLSFFNRLLFFGSVFVEPEFQLLMRSDSSVDDQSIAEFERLFGGKCYWHAPGEYRVLHAASFSEDPLLGKSGQ